MKLLLVAPLPPPVGGIQSVSVNLIRYVESHYAQARLQVYNTSHQLRKITSESLATRLYTGITNSLRTYYDVLKIMRNDMPDVIHLASSSSLALIKDLLIVKAGKKAKIPVVLHWHFGRIPTLYQRKNWEWKLLMKVIRQSAGSVVIDGQSYQVLKENRLTNIVYVPNPLSEDVEQKSRALLATPPFRMKKRVLYVGHLLRKKGVHDLVQACAGNDELVELVLIGPYEQSVRAELEALAGVRDEGKWLTLTGPLPREEVLEYMSRFEVLALPSYTEGFPMVVLEAMAMGCAIVATHVGAIPEMLDIGRPQACGICVAPGDVDGLRKALSELILNSGLCAKYGHRAALRVLERYTMEKIFVKYSRVWEKAMRKDGSSYEK